MKIFKFFAPPSLCLSLHLSRAHQGCGRISERAATKWRTMHAHQTVAVNRTMLRDNVARPFENDGFPHAWHRSYSRSTEWHDPLHHKFILIHCINIHRKSFGLKHYLFFLSIAGQRWNLWLLWTRVISIFRPNFGAKNQSRMASAEVHIHTMPSNNNRLNAHSNVFSITHANADKRTLAIYISEIT